MFSLFSPSRFFLAAECAFLFVILPLLLCAHTTRWDVPLVLWGVTAYAAFILHRSPGFSWKSEWRGIGWTRRDFGSVVTRFVISTASIVLLTMWLAPDRLLGLPLHRPGLWLMIMLLYPLLSALPQELVFRSFFFRRYAGLFPGRWMLGVSAFTFGFIHIVFHNAAAPLLSLACGFFLSSSYAAHGSLKKAAVEHGFYGDMVFTAGLGLYFVAGAPS